MCSCTVLRDVSFYLLLLTSAANSDLLHTKQAIPSYSNYPNNNMQPQNQQQSLPNKQITEPNLALPRNSWYQYPAKNIYQYAPGSQTQQQTIPVIEQIVQQGPQNPSTVSSGGVRYIQVLQNPTSSATPHVLVPSVKYQYVQQPSIGASSTTTGVVQQPVQQYLANPKNIQLQTQQQHPLVQQQTYAQPIQTYAQVYPMQQPQQGYYYQHPHYQATGYMMPQPLTASQHQTLPMHPYQYLPYQYASRFLLPQQQQQLHIPGQVPPISHYQQLLEQLYGPAGNPNPSHNQQIYPPSSLAAQIATAQKLIPLILGDSFKDESKSLQDEKKVAQKRQQLREEAVRKTKCKPGFVSLGGKCRSINIYSVNLD